MSRPSIRMYSECDNILKQVLLTFPWSFVGGGRKLCFVTGTKSGIVMQERKEEISCKKVQL